jgi:hypothetical protein
LFERVARSNRKIVGSEKCLVGDPSVALPVIGGANHGVLMYVIFFTNSQVCREAEWFSAGARPTARVGLIVGCDDSIAPMAVRRQMVDETVDGGVTAAKDTDLAVVHRRVREVEPPPCVVNYISRRLPRADGARDSPSAVTGVLFVQKVKLAQSLAGVVPDPATVQRRARTASPTRRQGRPSGSWPRLS